MDNNRTHLFLTRKKEETDEALRNLIRKLNMRKVDLEILDKKPTELFRRFRVVNSGTGSPLRLLRKIQKGEDPFFNINASVSVINPEGELVRERVPLPLTPRTNPNPPGTGPHPEYVPQYRPRTGGGKKTLKLKAKKNRNTTEKIKTKVIKSKIKKIKTSKKTQKHKKPKNYH